MAKTMRSLQGRIVMTIFGFVGCYLGGLQEVAKAQASTAGYNAVCTSNTTTCGVAAPSEAFIDAFASSQAINFSDLCLVPLMFPRAVAS